MFSFPKHGATGISGRGLSGKGVSGPGLTDRWPASAIWHSDEPEVRSLALKDLRIALERGYADFAALPSHALFLVALYPIIGLVVARMAFGYDTMHLVFPLIAGFAILGPVAAIGLYELSRLREAGGTPSATEALSVYRRPGFGGIIILGVVLMGLFALWMVTANALYVAIFGTATPTTAADFINQVMFTDRGHELILKGMGIGLIFAVVAMAISVFSIPMLIDRGAGLATAVRTSVRAVVENPMTMAAWGAIVAALLLIGSLPLFFGLAFVIPLLGHATWHLYRRAISRD
jgi:uncharacterized membrane protein